MTRALSPPLRNVRKYRNLSSQKRRPTLSGSKNMTGHIEAELYLPATEDTPEKVLSSDRVKITSSLFIMGDHTDYGQLLRPDLNTNYMWDCDLVAGTYQTPCSGIYGGESYLKSALSYASTGFTMDLMYDFIRGDDGNGRVYGDNYGYVQGTRKPGDTRDSIPPKLSFVANGGIKFGSTKGYGDGVFEVALLDVVSMVRLLSDKLPKMQNKL